ncbi:hypothetical protein BCV69DRAFT_171326 [Microstroma glucosiphilum]|uniref:Uncharacterized protein n=1 Tax=Pseudomicrostroma glucosiphilum TaxID=1684307 RepID=A0A316UAN1_9BASI|nr:hypothetical protein BCV69DRAFT_171326 [Pseudomicrostroma glucosiphilum]PWN21473.1 hypothetical protein BCV69DRAFT_171326 [Pseudomicrostroma glucosiphilum]
MMAPSISSAAARPSYNDPLSQASPSSSSSAAKAAGQKHFTSSPLSPSTSQARRSLERDLSDFSETSITSSSSTVGPPEGKIEDGELSTESRGSGGRGGGGWISRAGRDLHSPIEDDDQAPIIRRSHIDGEGSEAGSVTSAGPANGFTRSLGAAMEEDMDTDEQREARQIQSNLERWAAAERQRRKAARGSRILGPSSAEIPSPRSLPTEPRLAAVPMP